MFQKVLEYAGEYRKTTYLSMAVMLIGIVMNVLPFLFIYQLIRPLLLGESLELGYAAWRWQPSPSAGSYTLSYM